MRRFSTSLLSTGFAILFVFGVLGEAFAQRGGRGGGPGGGPPGLSISGEVRDAETGDPLTSATVALWSGTDSTVVRGTITNDDGGFTLDGFRPDSTLYVRVSYVGYEPTTIEELGFSRRNLEVDLGEIALAPSTEQMDEVQVSAERSYMEVQADKTIYNPQEQAVTAGGSALNTLEEVPSIDVDMEGNISLRGSEGVQIYLNGRPAPMDGQSLTSFLQGLNASDVKQIEVIPNPSAAYDPEGTSGIINIVLKEDTDRGWGGGVSASASTNESYNGSINAHLGEGDWSLFGNYSFRRRSGEGFGSRFRANLMDDPTTYLRQESDRARTGLSHNFNSTIEYALSSENTLALRSVFSTRGGDDEEITSYFERGADSLLTDRYRRSNLEEDTDRNVDLRLTFDRVIASRTHELTAEASWERSWEESFEEALQRDVAMNGNLLDGQIEDEQHVDETESENEAELRVDYVRPLPVGEDGSVELGYESEFEHERSEYFSESLLPGSGRMTPDDSLNNTFAYGRDLHSLFGTASTKFGSFNLQLGLRAERALTDLNQETLDEQFENAYFSVFPSVHLTYEASRSQNFNVSYSKRVRRPNSWQLNPFGDFTDPTFRRMGNPYLTPEYTHSMEIGFRQLANSYTLTVSPYYRHTVDAISWHEEITEDGVSILTFENFATENSFGLELIGSYSLADRFKANASFNAFKRQTNASNIQSSLSNDALGFMTRLRLTATIVEGLQLQFSQFYRSGHDIAGGSIGAFTRTNVALRQQLFGEKASLSIRGSDLLGDSSFNVTRNTDRFYQEFSRTRDSRQVQVSFRYNFGQQDDRRRGRDGPPEGGGGGGEGGAYGGGR